MIEYLLIAAVVLLIANGISLRRRRRRDRDVLNALIRSLGATVDIDGKVTCTRWFGVEVIDSISKWHSTVISDGVKLDRLSDRLDALDGGCNAVTSKFHPLTNLVINHIGESSSVISRVEANAREGREADKRATNDRINRILDHLDIEEYREPATPGKTALRKRRTPEEVWEDLANAFKRSFDGPASVEPAPAPKPAPKPKGRGKR